MRRVIFFAILCVASAGCGGGSPEEEVAVFEAVIRREVGEQKHLANAYVSIDGKDPSMEMLDRFVKKFPTLQPGSKAPQGKATHVSLSELKWINAHTAEVNSGFSNGMDGRHSRYRVVRKNGEWVVEKAEVTAIS